MGEGKGTLISNGVSVRESGLELPEELDDSESDQSKLPSDIHDCGRPSEADKDREKSCHIGRPPAPFSSHPKLEEQGDAEKGGSIIPDAHSSLIEGSTLTVKSL
jgi:hypothetical protein